MLHGTWLYLCLSPKRTSKVFNSVASASTAFLPERMAHVSATEVEDNEWGPMLSTARSWGPDPRTIHLSFREETWRWNRSALAATGQTTRTAGCPATCGIATRFKTHRRIATIDRATRADLAMTLCMRVNTTDTDKLHLIGPSSTSRNTRGRSGKLSRARFCASFLTSASVASGFLPKLSFT